jgi:hypothetical protein
MRLQVLRLETGSLGDARKHLGADLFTFVEREDDVGPAVSRKNLV